MAAQHLFDCDMDLFNQESLEPTEKDIVDQEGSVNVEMVLAKELKREVVELLSSIDTKGGRKALRGSSDVIRCPFCPVREFGDLQKQGYCRFRQHIVGHHGARALVTQTCTDYVASGSKQRNVIRALYDQCVAARKPPQQLLHQSASLMRSWLGASDSKGVSDALDDCRRKNSIDDELVLCLTGEGPKYMCESIVHSSGGYRCVGHTWYDMDFANIFLPEMVRCNGQAKEMAASLMHFFLMKGCPVVFLLPRKATTVYLKIMEDIMSSPLILATQEKLMSECMEHCEWVHLSMDGTVRMAMRVKGQGNYREPKEVRESYVVGDAEAKRRILTIRGRTGAVLMMDPVKSEGAKDVMEHMIANVPEDIRAQVKYLASDQPSGLMHQQLSLACPSLICLYLDEVHLCIIWHIAFWRKATPGQKALRKVQAKFNRVDVSKPPEYWGAFYTGVEDVSYSMAEEAMREQILAGTMTMHRATVVLNQLDEEKPWYCRIDYLQALAAIAAAFPKEMARKTYAQGRTIGHILWNAAAPDKMAWMWNAIIARRSMPQQWMILLPSGTASNESLHAEINRWWRRSPEVFPTTLQLHLKIASFGKLLTHNSGLYSPTLRQVAHDQVMVLSLAGVQWSSEDWNQWQHASDGGRAELPLFRARTELQKRIGAAQGSGTRTSTKFVVRKKPAAITTKKPATSLKKKPATGSEMVVMLKDSPLKGKRNMLRRTPFTLKRRNLG